MFYLPILQGREDELKELKNIFISTKGGDPGNIIIFGPKGIGKTCLLIKFQEEISDIIMRYMQYEFR